MISITLKSLGLIRLPRPLPLKNEWDCCVVAWIHKDRDRHDKQGKVRDKKDRVMAVCCDFIQNPTNVIDLPVLALAPYDGSSIVINKNHLIKHHVSRIPLQELMITVRDNHSHEDLTNEFQNTELTLLFTPKHARSE